MTEKSIVKKAQEWNIARWVDATGNGIEPIKLSMLGEKFKVIFCFQSWCPGCHSSGFPTLKNIVDAFAEKENIFFAAIQTVFEGFEENTYEKMLEVQKKYQIGIPFAHDAGTDNHSLSTFMQGYQTGGTPWFVLINKNNEVVYADFRINEKEAIEYLKKVV